MKINLGGSTITIDGKTFSGRSVSIIGDKVIIDGVEQSGSLVGPISVVVNGNAESVETSSGKVEVKGSAGSVKTTNGNISCGDVAGDVGTVNGDVTCGKVSGGVKTVNGDIRNKP